MSKSLEEMDQRNVLEYLSPIQPGQFGYVRSILLVWQILGVLATPFGLVIGLVGMFATVEHLISGGDEGFPWNRSSIEDWVGFGFWCVNAFGFMVLPLLYAVLCGVCRQRLKCGNISGAFLAERMCRWALRAGTIFAGGLAYGLGKALAHGRWAECPWWIVFLVMAICYGIAVEYTKRVIRKVSMSAHFAVKQGHPPSHRSDGPGVSTPG